MQENLDFQKAGGLIPAVIQDPQTEKILMVGFMNEEALAETLKSGKVTFFSRTKNRLWTKGETSGNHLIVHSIHPDCDSDTLLVKATPEGPVCHTGSDTCFNEDNKRSWTLRDLEVVIKDRKLNPKEGSYTTELFNKGINKMAQKVGEEAVELVIESKDQNKDLFLNEAADLAYHFLVLLQAKDIELSDVEKVLAERHK